MSYLIAASYNASGAVGVRYSTNNGVNWNNSTILGASPRMIVSSSNGVYMFVPSFSTNVYTSTNSGVSFSSASGNNFTFIASSSDSTFLVALDSTMTSVYKSTDYGQNWSPLSGISTSNYFTSIAISKSIGGSGYTIAVVDEGNINISQDSGSTWNKVSSFPGSQSTRFYSVACSATGTKMFICSYANSAGAIYYSTDSGTTWSLGNTSGIYGWYVAITCSDDGNTAYCCLQSNSIWKSTDNGQSWTSTSLTPFWKSIACSGDGSFAVAVADTQNIYTNNGITDWTEQAQSGANRWNGVTITATPVCVLGTTEILMADGTLKMIKDIQRGDLVMTDKKTGAHKKVCRVVNSLYDGYVVRIHKGLLGNHKPIILTGGHPIWVNKDQNRVCCRDIVKRQWVHVCELFYNIQFEDEGTYYANGVKMDSLSPNNHERKMPKELYFDISKYDQNCIVKVEDDPRRNKPKMIDRYVSIKTKNI
jgi:hypothetical protein